MTDLGAVLADLTTVPVEQIPAVLGELERMKAVLYVRLLKPATAATAVASRYVTQVEAANTFGIPLATVRNLTRRGIIPALGKGKNRRILPADLERHLARCAREGLAATAIPEVSRRRDRRRGAARPEGPRNDAAAVR